MSTKQYHYLDVCLLLAVLVLAACSAPVEERTLVKEGAATATEVTPIQEETDTPIPTDTSVPPTETATRTAVPSDTPSPLPTDTETPTNTPTKTPTIEPSETPTETPAPSEPPTQTLAPQPTSPPAILNVHTFPETPIRPFDVDDFISYLGQVRDSFRSFSSEMSLMMETGKYGDCGTFIGWIGLWILQAPGYSEVPADWSPLYAEYRSMLQQVVTITQEIRGVCDAEGGDVSGETIRAIVEFLSWAYPRSEQMVVEASSLPRP